MTKDGQLLEIQDSFEVKYIITCDNCGNDLELGKDEKIYSREDAAHTAYDIGWRFRTRKALCKECRKA